LDQIFTAATCKGVLTKVSINFINWFIIFAWEIQKI